MCFDEPFDGVYLAFSDSSPVGRTRQDMTAEYQTCGQMETWLLKDMGETADKQIDVAVTLRARDYKGLDNYGSNGVIEWKN